MCQLEVPDTRLGLNSPDPLVREAFLMAYEYIDYVTTGGRERPIEPAPTAWSAALCNAGDELLSRFPIFFRRWPHIFQDVTEETACPKLMSILDEHFPFSWGAAQGAGLERCVVSVCAGQPDGSALQ
ncbi:hypothetical protein EXN66_Car011970 [Channa argus]|uniref:Uncharacterized protein n=1 Tax=Channa argus TaxID=215402 RepID=A0A6G1Q1N8_CHAAH|nr:hypothetical protein EXN66_Car011970 [Channa argus]KAK2902608.1 hypothetical protein Q8A73_012354 [Channa argus]